MQVRKAVRKETPAHRGSPQRPKPRPMSQESLGYVRLLPILPLNELHLVLEPQLQLLQPRFFHLFVFVEITFLGECFETLLILRVFDGQLTKLLMTGEELVSRSEHPVRPPYAIFALKLTQGIPRFNPNFTLVLIFVTVGCD